MGDPSVCLMRLFDTFTLPLKISAREETSGMPERGSVFAFSIGLDTWWGLQLRHKS